MWRSHSGFRTMRGAFTLIELMVVVVVIAILAALIVPALQKAQSKAMAMKCLAAAKAIAASIRTYATENGGWTNPDASAVYVRDAGFRLAQEEGYFGEQAGSWATDNASASYRYATTLRQYTCPVDEGPRITRHAVPTSYNVVTPFNGGNIMNLNTSADQTLCVVEAGATRHFSSSGDPAKNFVYADLHATVGFQGNLVQGMYLRAWNLTSESGILNVNPDSLSGGDYESFLPSLSTGAQTDPAGSGAPPYWKSTWALQLVGALDASKGYPNDWNNGWTYSTYANSGVGPGPSAGITGILDWYVVFMNNIIARADGFLKFPEPGTWEFRVDGNSYNYLWFGIGGPDKDPVIARSGASYALAAKPNGRWTFSAATDACYANSATVSVNDHSLFYPVHLVYRGTYVWTTGFQLQGGWAISWRRKDPNTGQYDPNYGGAAGQRIPDQYVSTLPY